MPSMSESVSESEHRRPPYRITTRFEDLDLVFVQAFLSTSYWATGISLDVLERACRGSLCFGLFHDAVPSNSLAPGREQVGFARVITDFATFAYLADVFVTKPHRGAGLATWMVECALEEPRLHGLRRWMLATRDAHDLYEKLGFSQLADPRKFMERVHGDHQTGDLPELAGDGAPFGPSRARDYGNSNVPKIRLR